MYSKQRMETLWKFYHVSNNNNNNNNNHNNNTIKSEDN